MTRQAISYLDDIIFQYKQVEEIIHINDQYAKIIILKESNKIMDKVSLTFDKWAKIGRDELMEKEHRKSVLKFLKKISFDEPFSFLDVGCGNGWVVRLISQNPNCIKAIGIDKSKIMIQNAKEKKSSLKESYFVADIENWESRRKFDFIFSMESLYYSKSIPKALKKIFKLLNPDGKYLCGTDFYSDNKGTNHWSEMMKVTMHLHSTKEWKKFFLEAGFETKIIQVKDPKGNKKWKREHGTLFIIGTKPE